MKMFASKLVSCKKEDLDNEIDIFMSEVVKRHPTAIIEDYSIEERPNGNFVINIAYEWEVKYGGIR